jgi:hypothetical protein
VGETPVADGRSPGSRLGTSPAFPTKVSGIRASLAAYSCGGSQGIGEIRRTLFPFHPRHMRARRTIGGKITRLLG